jgi:hypothetical protein
MAMRTRLTIASVLAGVVLLVACHEGGAGKPSPLAQLGQQIEALPIDGDAHTLPLPKDVALTVDDSGFVLAFAVPIEARELAKALGWARPYAVAGDVHQQSWRLQLYVKPLADAHNKRIATTAPRLGAWAAQVELDGRPAGELPELVAGASPAYDLERRSAKVVRVRFLKSP